MRYFQDDILPKNMVQTFTKQGFFLRSNQVTENNSEHDDHHASL